jgi:molybdopterin molybdotransferase
LDRVLAEDVAFTEYIPAFDRSTVDGYALKGSDVFGCSDAMPAILKMVGEALMGKHTEIVLQAGQCVSVPTGGEIPQGADAVVMLEDTEDFGDGTIGVRKPCAPGANLIFRGMMVNPAMGSIKKERGFMRWISVPWQHGLDYPSGQEKTACGYHFIRR